MTDNVTLPGTGIPIATDDIAGIHTQRVKVQWGPDNTVNDADVASGKPLPTQLRHSDGTIVTDATGIKISTASQLAAVADNADAVAASASLLNNPVVSKVMGWNGTTYDRLQVDAAKNLKVAGSGNVAHAATDSGNPVKIGGRARSSEITAVANDQRTDFVADLTGKQIVLLYANPENFVSGAITTAMTATTTTSLIAAPAAGLRNYITQITVSNSHATVGTDVVIQDGSGGATLYTIPAAAVYGGAVLTFPTPLRQPTTATAIFCANVTTGASTKVSASGYKGA